MGATGTLRRDKPHLLVPSHLTLPLTCCASAALSSPSFLHSIVVCLLPFFSSSDCILRPLLCLHPSFIASSSPSYSSSLFLIFCKPFFVLLHCFLSYSQNFITLGKGVIFLVRSFCSSVSFGVTKIIHKKMCLW